MLRALVLAALACAGQTQVIRLGGCNRYVGDGNFDAAFIKSLSSEPQGFYLAVTNGDAERRCQTLTFTNNGTFSYTFMASNLLRTDVEEITGTFTARPSTFTELGSITLQGLPISELGASLRGRVTLNVIMAERNRILLSSCLPFGVANSETVHVLIPPSHYTGTAGLEAIHKLKVKEFPQYGALRQTSMMCENSQVTGAEQVAAQTAGASVPLTISNINQFTDVGARTPGLPLHLPYTQDQHLGKGLPIAFRRVQDVQGVFKADSTTSQTGEIHFADLDQSTRHMLHRYIYTHQSPPEAPGTEARNMVLSQAPQAMEGRAEHYPPLLLDTQSSKLFQRMLLERAIMRARV